MIPGCFPVVIPGFPVSIPGSSPVAIPGPTPSRPPPRPARSREISPPSLSRGFAGSRRRRGRPKKRGTRFVHSFIYLFVFNLFVTSLRVPRPPLPGSFPRSSPPRPVTSRTEKAKSRYHKTALIYQKSKVSPQNSRMRHRPPHCPLQCIWGGVAPKMLRWFPRNTPDPSSLPGMGFGVPRPLRFPPKPHRKSGQGTPKPSRDCSGGMSRGVSAPPKTLSEPPQTPPGLSKPCQDPPNSHQDPLEPHQGSLNPVRAPPNPLRPP